MFINFMLIKNVLAHALNSIFFGPRRTKASIVPQPPDLYISLFRNFSFALSDFLT